MGIAAVPGAGKTWTLSRLAADLIERGGLQDDQEILVVTLVNSAVGNFTRRVGEFIRQANGLPGMGYRVRTLHGLAHDIVRERPGLVGLDDRFQIIDEREADAIRNEVARSWLHRHPDGLDHWLDESMEESRREWVRREMLPALVQDIALSFIRRAKDLRLTPNSLSRRLDESPPLPLVEMGLEIYSAYQRAIEYRGGVDFDDLIRLALEALERDPDYLARLRYRWPYILEDEAQDSNRVQEQILGLLCGPNGNWVRVGDPNQAIYETFTNANPKYLLEFLGRADVVKRDLPESGRSSASIIWLANRLAGWVRQEHPLEDARIALMDKPQILPTGPGDPQPNPPDNPAGIHFAVDNFTPQMETVRVADSVQKWLAEHPDQTVAVLAPRNKRGFEISDELRRRNVEVVDSLLRSSNSTRSTVGALTLILRHLCEPQSAAKLANVYKVWRRGDRGEEAARKQIETVMGLLKGCGKVEDYLWPGAERDWLLDLEAGGVEALILERLNEFRAIVQRWHKAAVLPPDQLLLTISQDLMTEPAELAVVHKLAALLRRARVDHPEWRLPELTEELAVIAKNERRFLGFSDEDTNFNPDSYPGKVVVATVHKAKGLEWDRVYLVSVNNYDYPGGGAPGENFIGEKFYLRSQLNLEAETLTQLEALLSNDPYAWYQEGEATLEARRNYIIERLRLFYVGVTRARKELIVTWNTGRRGNCKPALVSYTLEALWKERLNGPAA
jgi:DNA helicase-2/ATP-dependent DNA helicase PcrA